MSKPSVLIRKSTGEIIKHAIYPREDMGEILGLYPDLEWLVKYIPFERPEYDSRLFILEIMEEVTQEPHPEYPHLNKYNITYGTKKRTDEEIIAHIENAAIEANEQLVDSRTGIEVFMAAIAALIKLSDSLQIDTKEQRILDKALESADKIWKNKDQLQSKIQQLADGEEPDIDSQWEGNNIK